MRSLSEAKTINLQLEARLSEIRNNPDMIALQREYTDLRLKQV